MSGPVFTSTRFREGYHVDDVDDFLADVVPRVGDRPDPTLARRIVGARFRAVRWSVGYDMSEVDAYLDELVQRVGGPPSTPA